MLYVLNDLHLGVNRSGGTTPTSYAAMVESNHEDFETLLDMCDGPLLINGDLFDGFLVSNRTLLRTYAALKSWKEKGHTLFLARGNHDVSKDSTKLSSFDLLGQLLSGNGTWVIDVPYVNDDFWILPHAPNQTIYDEWVQDVVKDPRPVVFVHTNFDNNFAVESDHSLNTSRDQVKEMIAAGVKRVIFGHEHVQKDEGAVLIVGNQFPTSISDCLGNERKRMLCIHNENDIRAIDTWEAAGSYRQIDWKKLSDLSDDAQFVRVTGDATAEETSQVLDTISQLRKRHSAYIISNAVKIDGRSLDTSALDATETLQQFNVIEFLMANLDNNEQRAAVRERLEKLDG